MTDIEIKQAESELLSIPVAVKNDVKKIMAGGIKSKSVLKDVINKLFPENTKYFPTKLNETQTRLNEAMIVVNLVNNDNHSSVAFVFKQGRGEFGMFIDKKVEPNAHEYLKLHEYGHILFNHCSGLKFHKQQYEVILNRNFKKVERFFSKNVIKVYSQEKLVNFLYHKFANIAQDMEINSKLFGNEWRIALHTIRRSQLLLWCDKKSQRPLIAKEILAKVNNKKSTIDYCHPSIHKWPEEMDWLVYMQYILNNIEKFLEFDTNATSDGGDGEDSGLYTEREIEAQETGLQEQDAVEKENGKVDENGNPADGKQRGDGEGNSVHELEVCNSLDNFKKIIEKYCRVKTHRKMVSDVFYYSNRNRNMHSGGVLNPRRTYREIYTPSAIHIIVDVSGSVPVQTVQHIISTLIEVNSFDKKRSRLIQWDTSLQGDIPLTEKTFKIKGFGGTRIARGISYVSKYIKKKTDKLFIISDFGDYLEEWAAVAKTIKCEKIAICHDASYLQYRELSQEFKKEFKTYLINI